MQQRMLAMSHLYRLRFCILITVTFYCSDHGSNSLMLKHISTHTHTHTQTGDLWNIADIVVSYVSLQSYGKYKTCTMEAVLHVVCGMCIDNLSDRS